MSSTSPVEALTDRGADWPGSRHGPSTRNVLPRGPHHREGDFGVNNSSGPKASLLLRRTSVLERSLPRRRLETRTSGSEGLSPGLGPPLCLQALSSSTTHQKPPGTSFLVSGLSLRTKGRFDTVQDRHAKTSAETEEGLEPKEQKFYPRRRSRYPRGHSCAADRAPTCTPQTVGERPRKHLSSRKRASKTHQKIHSTRNRNYRTDLNLLCPALKCRKGRP